MKPVILCSLGTRASILYRGIQCAPTCRFTDKYLTETSAMYEPSFSLNCLWNSFLEYTLKLYSICTHFKNSYQNWNDKIILQIGYRK